MSALYKFYYYYYTININVDGIQVTQTTHGKLLDLILTIISFGRPSYMTPQKQSPQALVSQRVRSFVSLYTTVKIYKGFIESHFNYCSAVWDGLPQQLRNKLQKQQNRALTLLGGDNVSIRMAKQNAYLMYKCTNNLAPAYFSLQFTCFENLELRPS